MSTPEERLRETARKMASEKALHDQEESGREARERAELTREASVAASEANAWIVRARELVKATGYRVPLRMQPLSEPGFKLSVGQAEIQTTLREDGWRIMRTSGVDLPAGRSSLPLNLAGMRDQILEAMIEQGLRDLMEGRVGPGPE